MFWVFLHSSSAVLLESWARLAYLVVRLCWGEAMVRQEFRHIPVVCAAPCTPSLFSLSSPWVLWRSGDEGRVVRVETGRASQRPLRAANRWDLTPSSHTNAGAPWASSRDCWELVFTPTTAESASEGDSSELRAKAAKVDGVQGGLIKGVYKLVCWGRTHPVIDFNRWQPWHLSEVTHLRHQTPTTEPD